MSLLWTIFLYFEPYLFTLNHISSVWTMFLPFEPHFFHLNHISSVWTIFLTLDPYSFCLNHISLGWTIFLSAESRAEDEEGCQFSVGHCQESHTGALLLTFVWKLSQDLEIDAPRLRIWKRGWQKASWGEKLSRQAWTSARRSSKLWSGTSRQISQQFKSNWIIFTNRQRLNITK